jgi:hypothetical protein
MLPGMPKRSSKPKKPENEDELETASRVFGAFLEKADPDAAARSAAAKALGRRGGLKGGAARAAALTPKKRAAIAKKAAKARWSTTKKP